MQMVILAGGLATRLGDLALNIPKSMIRFRDKPFLQYQLELLAAAGVRDIVLCTGHLGDQIENYFGDGRQFGVRIQTSRETQPMGTGGALKKAEPFLKERFMVMYGDSYLHMNYQAVWAQHGEHPTDGLMTVYRNEDLYDPSNLEVENGYVSEYSYDKAKPRPYIDYGLTVLPKTVLRSFPEGKAFGLREIFQRLIGARRLRAYEVRNRFYEIGSRKGIESFQRRVDEEKV